MSQERDRGKPRTRLPRSRDLKASERPATAAPSTEAREASGRFGPGNTAARNRSEKRAIAGTMSAGAKQIYAAVLRWLGVDVPPVRSLVMLHAEHLTNFSELSAAARKAGLATPEGQRLRADADEQSKRAERTLISAADMAKIEGGNAPPISPFADLFAAAAALPDVKRTDDRDEAIESMLRGERSETSTRAPATTITQPNDPNAMIDIINPAKALAKQQADRDDFHASIKRDRNVVDFDPLNAPKAITPMTPAMVPTAHNFGSAQAHAMRMAPAMGYGGTLGNPPVANWPPQARALRVLSEVEQTEQEERNAKLRAEFERIHGSKS